MVLWHQMRGGVGKLVLLAAAAAFASAMTETSAIAQSPSGTEWYRQPAPGQPAPAQPPPAPAAGQPAPAQPAGQGNVPPQQHDNGGAVNGGAMNHGVFAPPAIDPALRPYQMPGVNNPYNGYGSVSGLYPSAEMNSYVNASARAATARALFRQAESELGQVYRASQRSFDVSPQYKQAIKDEQEVYVALTAARTKAFSSLEGDQKYQRLLALREDLAAKLLDGRVYRTLSNEEIVAMAALKMSYATEMRAIEASALANEGSVKEAQDRLVQAGSRVSELRQQFEESLRMNPDILMARRNLDDARIAKLASDAYLRATMVNGRRAIDYAYYLYRTPSRYDNAVGHGYGGY